MGHITKLVNNFSSTIFPVLNHRIGEMIDTPTAVVNGEIYSNQVIGRINVFLAVTLIGPFSHCDWRIILLGNQDYLPFYFRRLQQYQHCRA